MGTPQDLDIRSLIQERKRLKQDLETSRRSSILDLIHKKKEEKGIFSPLDVSEQPEQPAAPQPPSRPTELVPGFGPLQLPTLVDKETQAPVPDPVIEAVKNNPRLAVEGAFDVGTAFFIGPAGAIGRRGATKIVGEIGERGLKNFLKRRAVGSGGKIAAGSTSAASGAAGSVAAELFAPSEDPAARAREAALYNVAADGIVSGFGAARRIFRGGSGRGTAADREALEAIQSIDPKAGTKDAASLAPAQALEDPGVIRNFQSVLEAAVVGGNKTVQMNENVARLANAAIDDLAGTIGTSATRLDVGQAFQAAISGEINAWKSTSQGLAGALDASVGGARVKTDSILKKLDELQAEFTLSAESNTVLGKIREALVEEVPAGPALVDAAGRSIQTPASTRARKMTFAEMQAIRSELLGVTRSSTELVKGKAKGRATALAKEIDREMQAAAKGLGPEQLLLWRTFNKVWSEGHKTFNSKFIKSLMREEFGGPEAVYDIVTSQASKRPERIRQAREVVGPEAWESIRGLAYEDLIGKAGGEGAVGGVALLNQLKRLGEPSGRELLGRKNYDQLVRLGKVLRRSSLNTGSSTGSLSISLTQIGAGRKGASAILQLMALGAAGVSGVPTALGGATLVLGGPSLVAKHFSNPQFVEALINGAKTKPGTKAAALATGRIIALSARIKGGEVTDTLRTEFVPGTENTFQLPPEERP